MTRWSPCVAPAAQALALSLVRPGGTLSIIAVQTTDRLAFTPIDAYDANLTVRTGQGALLPVTVHLRPGAEPAGYAPPTTDSARS